MSEDRRLGIQVTATDEASAKLKILEASLKSVLRAIVEAEASSRRMGVSSEVITAALRKEAVAIQTEMAAVVAATRAKIEAVGASVRLSEANTAAARSSEVLGRAISTSAESSASFTRALAAQERQLGAVAAASERATIAEARQRSLPTILVRRGTSILDESVRGQRGQIMATLGATLKDIGVSATAAATGLGGLVLIMATERIAKGAENMAKWAEAVRAGAAATGTSVAQFSQIQGALELVGSKASAGDVSLRQLARTLEQATANAASRQAQAFHALGISQQELVASGGNVYQMFMRIAQAHGEFANNANRAAAEAVIFGRSVEHLEPLLDRGADGIKALMTEAKRLGITLDTDTAAALSETGNKIFDLGITVEGRGIQMFHAWKPEIDGVISGLQLLVTVLGSVVSAVGTAANAVGRFIASASNTLGELEAGAIGESPDLTDQAGVYIKLPPKPTTQQHLPSAGLVGIPKVHHHGPSAETLAKRGYSEWAADFRNQLDEAKGNYQQQEEIIQEWGQKAAQIFAKYPHDYKMAMEAVQKATQEVWHQVVASTEQAAAAIGHANNSIVRGFEAQTASMAKLKEITPMQRYGFDIQEVAKMAVPQKQMLDQILNSPTADPAEKTRAYWQEWDLGVNLGTQIDELSAKWREEAQKDSLAYIAIWSSAFDRMGSQLDSAITEAIKSAFYPQKPEYWWTTRQGPHGQPLMVPHRISPVGQIGSQLGFGLLGDLGSALKDTFSRSIAQSIFGEGTTSISQGIATKFVGLFGLGGSGGLSQAAATTANTTALSALTAAVVTLTGVMGTSAASSVLSSGVGLAGFGGGLSGVGLGGFAKWAGGIIGLEHGGIVPSAAGGWVLGSFPGSTPALLHQREMVLPAGISEGLQSMIAGGGAGGMHMHFHGPADGPSIAKWFASNMRANSGAVKEFFRQNALTYRSI